MIIYKRDDKEYKALLIRIFWTNPKESYCDYRSVSDIPEDVITLTNESIIIDHYWDKGPLMGTTVRPINDVKYISIIAPYIEKKDEERN